MSRDDDGPADTIGGMRDLIRCVALALMLIGASGGGGCRQRDTDASARAADPAASETRLVDVSALPRDGITMAQRGTWHTQLMWPDDCEDAFRASHAADAGGIRVVRLGPAVSLVEVICAAGSYQPSALRFKLTEDSAGARSVPLSFPVYSSEDGRDLRLSQETVVWGESVVTPAAAEIAILSLARQTADCGVWARYSLAGDRPRLVAAAARLQCPTAPGPPVPVSASDPPAGWDAIPRKD
jgi:hypothetical protein